MKSYNSFEYKILTEYEYAERWSKKPLRSVVEVQNYLGKEIKVTVPTEIEGLPVTSMVDTFSTMGEIEEIILPEFLESINMWCFGGCEKLKKIEFPESLKSIGSEAFANCISLEEVIFPNCEDWLRKLKLGSRATGQNMLKNCPNFIDSQGFVVVNSLLLAYCGDETEITIPDKITKIADFAFFKQDKLTAVKVSDSVKWIGEYAFGKCESLTEITLPEEIKTLEKGVFTSCVALETMVIPDFLTEIQEEAFSSCHNLKNIHWGSSLMFIHKGAFLECKSLELIHFPEGLKEIEEDSFTMCSGLKEVYFPASVDVIQGNCFEDCDNIEKIVFAPREKDISENPNRFHYTEKMRNRFLEKGEEISEMVLLGFRKENVERYRHEQIMHWHYLSQESKDIIIKKWHKKTKIGRNRLRNLVFLQSTAKEYAIYFNEGCHLEFAELEKYLELTVKEEKTAETAILLDYKNKTFDNDYVEAKNTRKEMLEIGLELPTFSELSENWEIKVEDDQLSILAYKGEKQVEFLPESLEDGRVITKIGLSYGGFHGLTRLSLPESIKRIEDGGFSKTLFEEMNIPNSVQEIGRKAFLGSEIRNITLSNSLMRLETEVFFDCKHLETVILPESIEEIGERTFCNCHNLSNIQLPDSLRKIGAHCFSNCYSLEEIRIPAKIKRLGMKTFAFCVNLKRVFIPHEKLNLPWHLFFDCNALEFVGIEGGENILDKLEKSWER